VFIITFPPFSHLLLFLLCFVNIGNKCKRKSKTHVVEEMKHLQKETLASKIIFCLLGERTLRWTKNGTYGIHNFIFSEFLIQMFGVLGM